MSLSSDQGGQGNSSDSSERSRKSIPANQMVEIEKSFKDFKSVIDASTIDPLAIFYSPNLQIQSSIIAEQNEEFDELSTLLSQHGEHFAKAEVDALKELQIVNLFEVEQLLMQRRALIVQINNICQFYQAQGAGETKIDLMRSHAEDSTVQTSTNKLMQTVHKEDDFKKAVENLIKSTLEQIIDKDYLSIEFNFVVQQTLFRFNSFLKQLHDFCQSDQVFRSHIKVLKTEGKRNFSNTRLANIVKENLRMSPAKDYDDDPHHVMKQELNTPSSGSSGKSLQSQSQRSNRKPLGAAKSKSKTPKKAKKPQPDSSQMTTPKKGKKPKNSISPVSRTPGKTRGRPKLTNQNCREVLLKKADQLEEKKKLEKLRKQELSQEQNDDSSSEKEQVENEQKSQSKSKSISKSQSKSYSKSSGSKSGNDSNSQSKGQPNSASSASSNSQKKGKNSSSDPNSDQS